MRSLFPALLLLASCGRDGFSAVDHRVFYGAWQSRSPHEVPEGERTAAIRVDGTMADGRDATFVRVDRTDHNDVSLTPGCVGRLWRRGWMVADLPEVRGPDPSDSQFPDGREAELGELLFFVEEAVLSRQDCDDPDDDVSLQDAPTVLTPDDQAIEPTPYSRPIDDAWWIGGARDVLLRRVDDAPADLAWPR